MKKTQPDFKKSQNSPYDLNSSKSPQRVAPQNSSPNPYDLDQGYSKSQYVKSANIKR